MKRSVSFFHARALLASVLLPGLLAACTSQPTILPSRDFDRPTDITYVCMGAFGGATDDGGADGSTAAGDAAATSGMVTSGRPMRDCHPRNAPDPLPGPQHRTFGFLPNSANGQMSVIDGDHWKLVDLDLSIAGFNQYPMGRLPTQIASSDDGCRLVTANHGSCNLSLVNPAALLQPTLAREVPGLPEHAPGGLPAIGQAVYPSFGGKILPLIPQEIAFIPQDTAAMTGDVQLCTDAWTGQAIVTFPTCNLIALVNLPSGEIVDGMYVRRTSDGRVLPEPLAGRAPECKIVDCDSAGQATGDQTDGAVSDATPASDAGADADDAGAGTGAILEQATSVRPGPIAILPGGARAYVGLANAPFIVALDLKPGQLVVPPRPDQGVIELHVGAVGTNRLRLSIDPYADNATAPGYSGNFVGGSGPTGHSDRQYLYALARDGSLRVVHVAVDPETECETNVDPLKVPDGTANALFTKPCLPVSDFGGLRRPSAQGPGLRFAAPPIDVAVADVGDDHSETSVSGAHAYVLAANGVVYLVNINPVLRYTRYVEVTGDVKMCASLAEKECHPEDPAPAPNTPRNNNVMSYTPALSPTAGPPRLDVAVSQPQTGPRIESIWTRGTKNNAASDTTVTTKAPYIQTQVFFQDPTAATPQTWSVAWEGALSAPRASGHILVDGAKVTLQDPGVDYCRIGLQDGDVLTLTGCVADAQCALGQYCAKGTEGTLGAGGLPINGLCVNKIAPPPVPGAPAEPPCSQLLSTVRRYEVTAVNQSSVILLPRKDEMVLPSLDPCMLEGAAGGSGGTGGAPAIAPNKCINPNDPTTTGFHCVAYTEPGKTTAENRCLMPCGPGTGPDGVSRAPCRSGRTCVELPSGSYCADGPDLAAHQDLGYCFGELLPYQVSAGRSFLVAGSVTANQVTREVTSTGLCQDKVITDPRVAMRIPMNAPHCANVPDNMFDSRCNPDLGAVSGCTPMMDADKLLNFAKETVGIPNPCMFWGGPNEIDPVGATPLPEHVHALFRNNELQFMMTNLELPVSGVYQIRFDVRGGFKTQTVYNPPTIEVGMPARLLLGPFNAQLPTPSTLNAPDVPYLFVVDQRRLGRTQGGGPTRGQLLRIQPRGQAFTIPTDGLQPWFEDFTASGQLFPIQ